MFYLRRISMKQPKKLTFNQKKVLTKEGLDWHNYMLLTEDKDTFTVIAKKENEHGHKEQLTYSK